MEQNKKNEIDDHQDQGANGGLDSEQSNQTDDGEVDPSCCLLKCAWVDETLGVDIGVEHIQHVVARSQVYQIKTHGCESQNQRCNDRVRDCCEEVSCATDVRICQSLTDSGKERVDRKDGAPSESRERGKSFVHLSWRAVEKFAQDFVQDHPH